MRRLVLGAAAAAVIFAGSNAMAESVRDVVGPLLSDQVHGEEAPARILVDDPAPEALVHGRVVIQYRTEHLRIEPVFGPQAAAIVPRVGHIHVTVDDNPWRWADASGLPLIVNGLAAGPHKIRIDLENAIHQTIDSRTVEFVIPLQG